MAAETRDRWEEHGWELAAFVVGKTDNNGEIDPSDHDVCTERIAAALRAAYEQGRKNGRAAERHRWRAATDAAVRAEQARRQER